MERTTFNEQMSLLKRVYDRDGRRNLYPPEIELIFWKTFQHHFDDVFRDAVQRCMGRGRGYPMLAELEDAVAHCQEETAQARSRVGTGMRPASPAAVLIEAADKAPDPVTKEFAKACLQTFARYVRKEYSRDDFQAKCRLLGETAEKLSGKATCRRCGGEGWAFVPNDRGFDSMHRCLCAVGRSKPDRMLYTPADSPKGAPPEVIRFRDVPESFRGRW